LGLKTRAGGPDAVELNPAEQFITAHKLGMYTGLRGSELRLAAGADPFVFL
jgi:hypothetical protein